MQRLLKGEWKIEIKNPEWLQVEEDHVKVYGFTQDWYKTSFRKTRGCGPTVAAMLLSYMNRRQGEPLPYESDSISSIVTVLDSVWEYVTPGWLLGLNSTEKFCKGVGKLLGQYGLDWRCHRLSVSAYRSSRASLSQLVDFLENGIRSDCPIAFLNLHKGKETALESWHWIVLVSLSYDVSTCRYMATGYDEGRSFTFDVGLWLETTRLGGGFVYITAGST